LHSFVEFGQVLLLQAVVTALQQDMNARLAVFRAVSSSHPAASAEHEAARPTTSSMQALIMHSHLWRLLQV
jgi:adenine deaminase